MLHNSKLAFRALLKPATLTVALFSIAGLSGTAMADHAYHVDVVTPDPTNYEFRTGHPFKVFVDVNLGGEVAANRSARANHADTYTDQYTRERISHRLPPYIVLVSDSRSADMTVRATELNYQLSFRIIDVDRRNKKYKKNYRYTGGQCGLHQRAFYTRITEKGEAFADYQLLVNLKGTGRYKDTVQIRATESFRRGEALRAQTNCGIQPTVHFPNAAVAKLFARSNQENRQSTAFVVRKEATQKLANVIASTIQARSEQYYAVLAAHYTAVPIYRDTHYDREQTRGDIYNRDSDAVYPRRR